MSQPYYLDLELPEVTEWLPDNDVLSPKENDEWILREQAARYQLGGDRGSRRPVDEMFTM